jgi:hypothetical protein
MLLIFTGNGLETLDAVAAGAGSNPHRAGFSAGVAEALAAR